MRYFTRYTWILVVAIILGGCVHLIFNSGRVMACVWGLVMALTLFWMREYHRLAYGVTEVAAGLFFLAQGYANGRGGFSSGFNEAFQTFQGNVVLITTLGAIYIIVRGFDNIKQGLASINR